MEEKQIPIWERERMAKEAEAEKAKEQEYMKQIEADLEKAQNKIEDAIKAPLESEITKLKGQIAVKDEALRLWYNKRNHLVEMEASEFLNILDKTTQALSGDNELGELLGEGEKCANSIIADLYHLQSDFNVDSVAYKGLAKRIKNIESWVSKLKPYTRGGE
jgi:hypothetical protein